PTTPADGLEGFVGILEDGGIAQICRRQDSRPLATGALRDVVAGEKAPQPFDDRRDEAVETTIGIREELHAGRHAGQQCETERAGRDAARSKVSRRIEGGCRRNRETSGARHPHTDARSDDAARSDRRAYVGGPTVGPTLPDSSGRLPRPAASCG